MPIFYITVWLMVMLLYVIIQILYIIWKLKPNKHLLSYLIKNNYYYFTTRKDNNKFPFLLHNENAYRLLLKRKYITTDSPFTYLKWLFKYGLKGEIKDLTEKEKEEYNEFMKKETKIYNTFMK